MRRMIVVRGHSGCAGEDLLGRSGLTPFLILQPSSTGPGSRTSWSEHYEHLEARMNEGALVAVCAEGQGASALTPYADLARRRGYAAMCLDLSPSPLDEALRRLAAKGASPSPAALARQRSELAAAPAPPPFELVRWTPSGDHVDALRAFLSANPPDLSSWERIVHVGAVGGRLEALIEAIGPKLDEEAYWVFHGDYLGMGGTAAATLDWLLREVAGRPNAVLLRGDEEDRLGAWATAPRLRPRKGSRAPRLPSPPPGPPGVEPEEAADLLSVLSDAFVYGVGGPRVAATHAGLASPPDALAAIPSLEMTDPAKRRSADPDADFEACSPPHWRQVHGHEPCRGADADSRSVALGDPGDGSVAVALFSAASGFVLVSPERLMRRSAPIRPKAVPDVQSRPSGPVRPPGPVRPSEAGRPPASIRPPPESSPPPSSPSPSSSHPSPPMPSWAERGAERLSPEDLASCLRHPGLQKLPVPRHGHLVGILPGRKPPQDDWARTRALVIDQETGEVAARSHDGIPGLGAAPGHAVTDLPSLLRFPVRAVAKEDGLLCSLGWNSKEGRIVATTANGPAAAHVDLFRRVLESSIASENLVRLADWLSESATSLSFELLHPLLKTVYSPPSPSLVLIDGHARSLRPRRLRRAELKGVADAFGMTASFQAGRFDEWGELVEWLDPVTSQDPPFVWKGRELEGFLLEDSEGRRVSLRLPEWSFWRRMEALRRRASTEPSALREAADAYSDPRARDFVLWLCACPQAALRGVLSNPLAKLREAHQSGRPSVALAGPSGASGL